MPDPTEPDDLEKIARLAAKRGYWSERSATDMVAQARMHHAGPRAFLKKLLEIKCGLTYDEIARLEKEALAPPPPPPSSKPLPKPFDASATPPAAPEPATLATPSRALPRPFEGKRSGPVPTLPREPADASPPPPPPAPPAPSATPARALPRLTGKLPRPADPGATPDSGTIIEKKKLPSLGAKKDEPPPDQASGSVK